MAMALCRLASSEEESILSGASVLDFGRWMHGHGTSNYDDFIEDSFKSMMHSDTTSGMFDCTVDLGSSMPIVSIWLKNRENSALTRRQIGNCHFRIGDDATEFSTSNTVIVTGVVTGGLFEATSIVSGRYLTLRREAAALYG